jgi:membrane protease subunit (stomatin/prohibitin family)
MASIWFTGNYQDLSTDRGYQFKFLCEKCGNGYLSSFQVSKLGMASSIMRAAGNLFGGTLGNAANSTYEIQRAVGSQAHDAALKEAADEISKQFKQCTRCGKWVCEPVCWNRKMQLCETCAPDLDEETAAAQADAARSQIQEKARSVDWTAQRDIGTARAVVCPSCNAKTQGGKFCPECGAALSVKKRCAKCGTEAEGDPKFCPECGQKYG